MGYLSEPIKLDFLIHPVGTLIRLSSFLIRFNKKFLPFKFAASLPSPVH